MSIKVLIIEDHKSFRESIVYLLQNSRGFECIGQFENCLIIILTVFEDNKNVFDAILAGANGYLLKKSSPERILKAIQEVLAGGAPMTPTIAKQALDLFKKLVPHKTGDNGLSQREKEVLNLLVQGFSNEEVAN